MYPKNRVYLKETWKLSKLLASCDLNVKTGIFISCVDVKNHVHLKEKWKLSKLLVSCHLKVKSGIFISCVDVKRHPGGQHVPILTQAKSSGFAYFCLLHPKEVWLWAHILTTASYWHYLQYKKKFRICLADQFFYKNNI